MPEGGTLVACAACDEGWDAKLCGCCDAANGGPKGFLCKYFCGPCATGKLMSFTGAEGEGPQAVAEPGNCFLCTICAGYCACCNYKKYREHNNIDGSPVNDFLATCVLGTGFCQVLNDYELKNGGSFGMMGNFEKNAGSPEEIVMEQ